MLSLAICALYCIFPAEVTLLFLYVLLIFLVYLLFERILLVIYYAFKGTVYPVYSYCVFSLSVTRGHTKSFLYFEIYIVDQSHILAGWGADVFNKSRPEHIGGNLCASTSNTREDLYRPNETVKLPLMN